MRYDLDRFHCNAVRSNKINAYSGLNVVYGRKKKSCQVTGIFWIMFRDFIYWDLIDLEIVKLTSTNDPFDVYYRPI